MEHPICRDMKKLILSIAMLVPMILAAQNTTFAFAGDVMMGTNYPTEANGAYLPANNGANLFDDCAPLFRTAHVAAANLEGTLFDTGGTPKACSNPDLCYTFRMPSAYVKNLTNVGMDFMSVANNHVNDFGDDGLRFTMANLKKAGIAYAGLRDKCPTAIIERNGKRIGFAAFGHSRGTQSIMNLDEVRRVVGDLNKKCDIVVVSFHGGGEGSKYSHVPHAMETCFGEQRGNVEQFAHTAVDAGADIVYGHGPHVTRAMELYKDRLIMYSLGNFCTPFRMNLNGVNSHAPVVTMSVDKDGRFVSGKIHGFIQGKGVGPRTDKTGAVVKQIKALTAADFPNTSLKISADGTLSK